MSTIVKRTSVKRLATILMLVLCTGCYRQQMGKQPSYHLPDQPSDFYADGQANRPIEPGTVARGQLRNDSARFTGKIGETYVAEFPVAISMKELNRGRERFNIYCAVCHGRTGRGDGQVIQRGYIHPPSYHDARLRDMPVGRFFEIITKGHGAMPDYEAQIPGDDRWAIIAYIRALQLSQGVPAADLTPEDRAALDGR